MPLPTTHPAAQLRVGVSVLILNERGEVLLQQRGDDGLWGTPGGGLNPGETFLESAHRELHEETGLICPDLHLLPLEEGVVDGPAFQVVSPGRPLTYLVGLRALGHLPTAALDAAHPDGSGETLALAWFPLNDLPPLSGEVNRANLNVLRRRSGLPPLNPACIG